jgi:hypothetical protein
MGLGRTSGCTTVAWLEGVHLVSGILEARRSPAGQEEETGITPGRNLALINILWFCGRGSLGDSTLLL